MIADLKTHTPKGTRAALVGLSTPGQPKQEMEDFLDELAFLAETAGAVPLKSFTQRLDKPHPRTFVGTGKVEEIREYVRQAQIELVVFDEELSPSQIRNIEKTLACRVLDRTNLILDIFASRAKTAHAKVQVELAQYQYFLPRLAGLWTHLERQRGGIGLRGPGETEIETDRRIIRDKISRLQNQLGKIDKQMASQRKNRGSMVRVALVGYTNVGKSTLMNLLSKSEVFAENKLFATLDTTVRKVVIGNLPFLLSDTVGFIRKLPHSLVESFKSTLDEVREADLLVHVVDVSHPNFENHIRVVDRTLYELEVHDKPGILLFNKIDAYKYNEKEADDLSPATRDNFSLEQLQRSWMAKPMEEETLFVSAKKKQNMDALRDMLYKKVRKIHSRRYPYNNYLY